MSVTARQGKSRFDPNLPDNLLEGEVLQDEIVQESARVFRSGHWAAPFGTLASSLLFAVLSRTYIADETLVFWFAAMAITTMATFASFSIRCLKSRTTSEGLPRLSSWSHVGTGVLFGLTLWLDLDATRDSTFRWATLAFLVAVSASSANARSSMSTLGIRVIVPIWGLAGAALLTVDKPVAALACFAFVGLLVIELAANRSLLLELISLRVTSNRVAEDREWAATHDPLTKLANRQGMMDSLGRRRRATDAEFTAMFIDLDHFKQVNDRLGHKAGDEVLIEVAYRLLQCFRPNDTVCRLGGDEFVVLVDGGSRCGALDNLAERVIFSLELPFRVHDAKGRNEEAFISASIGMATYPHDSETSEQLIVNADQALYAAKRQGRRQAVRFSEAPAGAGEISSEIETALRRAIHMGGIEADAQPIFSIATGEIAWVELLARFTMPNGEPVPPSVFVPLADEIGLAGELMSRMIDIAGQILPQWQSHGHLCNAKVGINASPIQLIRNTMVRQVTESLALTKVDPARLVLEICESGAIDGVTNTAEQLEALHALGVNLAIHDFGVGYSSPNELLDLPLYAVKLNRRLLHNIETDERHLHMLRAICQLAGAIAPTVVAEGIETSEQLDLIKEFGISAAQGYYLGRPVPVDELAAQVPAD